MTESLPSTSKPRAQLRTALVTGGSRGVGKAIVEQLRADGMVVTAPCRKYADLNDYMAQSWLAGIVARMPVDVLVNCAGINVGYTALATTTDELDTTYTVNIRAPFVLAQALLPGMVQRGYGRIVNIASIFSIVSRPNRTAYTMSKCALHGLTLALSAEFARTGVLTNTVSPGMIDTDMTRNRTTFDERRAFVAQVPVGRLGQADEVARLVAWLASDTNTYVTGQNIAIDGGFVGV